MPPLRILPFSTVKFSVSGRDGSPVAPSGKVFYCNRENNLNVTFEWGYSGFTAITSLMANVLISGVHPIERKSWDQTFVGSFDADSWTYIIRPREPSVVKPFKTPNLPVRPEMQPPKLSQNDAKLVSKVLV